MPSLFRFLTVVAVIGGIVYGVIFALANFVNPKPREMTVTIPADTVARDSCNGAANMLVINRPSPIILMVNAPPEALTCPACSAF